MQRVPTADVDHVVSIGQQCILWGTHGVLARAVNLHLYGERDNMSCCRHNRVRFWSGSTDCHLPSPKGGWCVLCTLYFHHVMLLLVFGHLHLKLKSAYIILIRDNSGTFKHFTQFSYSIALLWMFSFSREYSDLINDQLHTPKAYFEAIGISAAFETIKTQVNLQCKIWQPKSLFFKHV